MSGWTNTEVTGWADSWDRDTAAVPATLLRGPRGPTITKHQSPVWGGSTRSRPKASQQPSDLLACAKWRVTPTQCAGDSHTWYLLRFAQWKLGTATENQSTREGGEEARPGGGASPGWGAPRGQREQGILAPPKFAPHLTPLRSLAAAGPAGPHPADWPLTPRWAPPPPGHTAVEGTVGRAGAEASFPARLLCPQRTIHEDSASGKGFLF